MRALHLFFRLHCPYELRQYDGTQEYFGGEAEFREADRNSYQPFFALLERNVQKYDGLKVSLVISGTWLELAEKYDPELIRRLRKLADLNRIEAVAEPYYYSLASFYNVTEFTGQVEQLREHVRKALGLECATLAMSDLIYHDKLAKWAHESGYKVVIGGDATEALSWQSANRTYSVKDCDGLGVLFENARLSRAIMGADHMVMVETLKASEDFGELDVDESDEEPSRPTRKPKASAAEFVKGMAQVSKEDNSREKKTRAGRQTSGKWVFSAQKFQKEVELESLRGNLLNLCLDVGIFGAYRADGIISFFDELIRSWLQKPTNKFLTASEVVEAFEPKAEISIKNTVSWRLEIETEPKKMDGSLAVLKDVRFCPPDYLRNSRQVKFENTLYALRDRIEACKDRDLLRDFRRLTALDYLLPLNRQIVPLYGVGAQKSEESEKLAYDNLAKILNDIEERVEKIETELRPKLTKKATEEAAMKEAQEKEKAEEESHIVTVHRVPKPKTEEAMVSEDERAMDEWQDAGEMEIEPDDETPADWSEDEWLEETIDEVLDDDEMDDMEAEVQVMAQRASRSKQENKRELDHLVEAEVVSDESKKKRSKTLKRIMKKIVIE